MRAVSLDQIDISDAKATKGVDSIKVMQLRYDEEEDMYTKKCKTCDHQIQYEKM